jgi:hypothetical protein
VFQVRPLATFGAVALCLGVMLAGLGGGTAAAASGSLPTATTISAVPSAQPFGVPGQQFVINVTSSIAPTGTVAVYGGGKQLCSNLVLNPIGSADTSSAICIDTSDTLALTDTVTALYSPDTATFAPSSGNATGDAVAASTAASLSTSKPTGTWGAEQKIVFTGTVTNTQLGSFAIPTGTITVEHGATVICTIQLPSGSNTGTCSPGPTGLAPGADEALTAIYDGDTNFSASAASAPVTETIAKAAATVTANSRTMVYGGGVPALTTTISGLVAGQTLATSGISGQAACTSTATRASGVGAYPITCSVGTLASSNYSFAFAPGTLTIFQAATTTTVNVSASTVTVSVAPQFSGNPPGTVAVSLGGTSTSCTLITQASGPSNCSVPAPTSLAAGTYPVTASYGASADFAGSSGSGQLVVATSSSGSTSGGSSGGNTSGNGGTSGGTKNIYVDPYYQSPQQLSARVAAGQALLNQLALQALQQAEMTQEARNGFLKALHNLKGRSSSAEGLAGATSGSAHGQVTGPDDHSGSGGGRNGSSSNPTTINLVASQSGSASPAITALLVGLLILALVVIIVAAMRRKSRRAGVLVVSAGDDQPAE